MATAPSPNDLTRQQLDELDALLQRMLSLPLPTTDQGSPAVSKTSASIGTLPLPDPVVPAAVKNWRVDPATPAPTATPHLLIAPIQAEPPVSLPRRAPEPPVPPEPVKPFVPELPRQPTPPPPVIVENPLPTPVAYLPFAEPELEPEPPRPAPPPVFRKKVVEAEPPVPSRNKPYTPSPYADVSPLFWPLAAFNRVADGVLGLFGPPGKLLRSGFGKNLLGLAGLGLLLYTAAHVAQLRGWVLLPAPVPWPQ
jgi:hypothetical protein